MSGRALLRLGLRGLLLHKLRSILSILGVVFGVAAVVAMSSVGEGARREAVQQITSLGIDTVTARPSARGSPAPVLRLRDAQSVGALLPHLLSVAPLREGALTAASSGRQTEAAVVGTTPSYQMTARLQLSSGRFLTDLDVADRKRVAVIGASAARALFPLGSACGQWLLLGGDWFQVVGVLESRATTTKKASPIRTRDVNRTIFVPLPSLDRGGAGDSDGIEEIVMRFDNADHVLMGAEVLRAVIKRTTGGAGVDIIVPREIMRQKERTQTIFNVVTGAIAAISLLVGGIGIMNIMLASVAQREKEVGIRRALGATRRDIGAQFLVESSLLTSAGGVLGATLGLVGSILIERLAEWPTALSPHMLLLALLMALAVGIGFGLYPAWQASRLEPMEALRHE